jgi:hypothetical protein
VLSGDFKAQGVAALPLSKKGAGPASSSVGNSHKPDASVSPRQHKREQARREAAKFASNASAARGGDERLVGDAGLLSDDDYN